MQLINNVFDPLYGISVSYCFMNSSCFSRFHRLLIGHSGSFALPALMGGTGIALRSQFNNVRLAMRKMPVNICKMFYFLGTRSLSNNRI